MKKFSTVHYELTTKNKEGVLVNLETGEMKDENGNPVEIDIEPARIKRTYWWKGEGLDVVLHRDNNQPAIIKELVPLDSEKVFLTLGLFFYVDGKEYRTDGPTDIQGDQDIIAEYNYGDRSLDVVLQILHSQDLIGQKEFNQAMKTFKELPQYTTREEYEFFNLKKALPFKDKVASIVKVIDKASKNS